MRVRYLMITACIATAFAACAGAETQQDLTATSFGTVCEARCTCEECSPDESKRCDDEQDAIATQARKSCADQETAYSDCVRQKGRCVDGHHVAELCNVQAAILAGCLDPETNCPTAGDGVCDEPSGTGQCADGTDPADCLAPCPSTGNGICDEPEGTGQCPAGTDVADCKLTPCASVNNRVCDEPGGTGMCDEGTDVADCKLTPCASVNDGVCDEPEGTGLCLEGSDVVDCMAPTSCDTLGVCGDDRAGCRGCAIAGSCSTQYNACNSNSSCRNLEYCLQSCFGDQFCIDDCRGSYPGGVLLSDALTNCVVCGECSTSCNGFGSGC